MPLWITPILMDPAMPLYVVLELCSLPNDIQGTVHSSICAQGENNFNTWGSSQMLPMPRFSHYSIEELFRPYSIMWQRGVY
jgi:hypothetical protein